MISMKKCLEIMHSGAVFSLRVVTYDKRRKDRTGQVREYAEAVLVWGQASPDPSKGGAIKGERPPTVLEKSLLTTLPPLSEIGKNPNHALHYTRNIRILVDGQPTEAMVQIHPPLIIEFNGQTTTP